MKCVKYLLFAFNLIFFVSIFWQNVIRISYSICVFTRLQQLSIVICQNQYFWAKRSQYSVASVRVGEFVMGYAGPYANVVRPCVCCPNTFNITTF